MTATIKQTARPLSPRDITLIYLLFSLFFAFAGFLYADLTSDSVSFDFSGIEAPGIGPIFVNNIAFFSLICITPFLNFAMSAVQFVAIGNNIFQIRELPLGLQAVLLYRHAVFEVIALMLSVYISYEVYRILRDYLHKSIRPERKRWIRILICYAAVALLTLSGACLEGTVNV